MSKAKIDTTCTTIDGGFGGKVSFGRCFRSLMKAWLTYIHDDELDQLISVFAK